MNDFCTFPIGQVELSSLLSKYQDSKSTTMDSEGSKRLLKRRNSASKNSLPKSGEKEEAESNAAADELLQLQWSNHSTAFGAAMAKLRSDETFCDVTLVSAQGEQFSAHKVVISACSSHLQSMLTPLPRWQHPVLLMPKDLPSEDLRDILAFMYSGEVCMDGTRKPNLYPAQF